jgi:hypothetical protein
MENFYGIAGLWLCTVTNWWSNNWVSVAGVVLTVWFAWRAKTAAEQAHDAAREARNRILGFDALAAISAAVETMQEIKAGKIDWQETANSRKFLAQFSEFGAVISKPIDPPPEDGYELEITDRRGKTIDLFRCGLSEAHNRFDQSAAVLASPQLRPRELYDLARAYAGRSPPTPLSDVLASLEQIR